MNWIGHTTEKVPPVHTFMYQVDFTTFFEDSSPGTCEWCRMNACVATCAKHVHNKSETIFTNPLQKTSRLVLFLLSPLSLTRQAQTFLPPPIAFHGAHSSYHPLNNTPNHRTMRLDGGCPCLNIFCISTSEKPVSHASFAIYNGNHKIDTLRVPTNDGPRFSNATQWVVVWVV